MGVGMFRRHRASAPAEQANRLAPELSEAELERLTAPEAADARPAQSKPSTEPSKAKAGRK